MPDKTRSVKTSRTRDSLMIVGIGASAGGLKAVEKAKKKRYNLILMDLHMPVMDGFEAARRIRKLSGYRDVTIIALTADISDRIKKELRSGLFSDLNIKPFEPEKLNKKIAEIAAKAKEKE